MFARSDCGLNCAKASWTQTFPMSGSMGDERPSRGCSTATSRSHTATHTTICTVSMLRASSAVRAAISQGISFRSEPPIVWARLRQRSCLVNRSKPNCERRNAWPGCAEPNAGGSHCRTSSVTACSACTLAAMLARRVTCLTYHSLERGNCSHARMSSAGALSFGPGAGCSLTCLSIACASCFCMSESVLMTIEEAIGAVLVLCACSCCRPSCLKYIPNASRTRGRVKRAPKQPLRRVLKKTGVTKLGT